MPVGAPSFKEALRWCAEVFHALASILKAKGLATSVGDEGGFAPNLSSDEETIEDHSGRPSKRPAISPAGTSCWPWTPLPPSGRAPRSKGFYKLPKAGKKYTSSELIAHWKSLVDKYPIISIEDGLDEEDWEGWQDDDPGHWAARSSWWATTCSSPTPSVWPRASSWVQATPS